jgi:hypothetical protein
MKTIISLILFASIANATPDCVYDVWESRLPKGYQLKRFKDDDGNCVLYLQREGHTYASSKNRNINDAFQQLLEDYKSKWRD